VLFAFLGKFLVSVFIKDERTVEAGAKMLGAFIWGLPFLGIQMTFMVTYQALGKPMLATIVTMGRQFLVYLPLLFILNHFWQFAGYIYSQPIADIITTGVAAALSSFVFREINGKG
jgi:Na+-driven multidrug efflux pump